MRMSDLLRELPIALLLQQSITFLPCCLKTCVRLLELPLQYLPALGITVGLNGGFLGVEFMQPRLQRDQAALKLFKPLPVLLARLLQVSEFALPLLHALQQWAVRSFRRLAFSLQSGLALFELAQSRTLLFNFVHQSLFFPSAGGERLTQFQ